MPVIKNNGHSKPRKGHTGTSMSKSQFPPNVPPELIAKFEAAGCNMSELARRLEINKAHIHNLLVEGKEPRNKTLRAKLCLPAKVREAVPAWVIKATRILASLEEHAPPVPDRIYSRNGKRVR